MKGYKGFNKDMTCRDMQYEIGKEYELKDKLKICGNGFHFCKEIEDVQSYYNIKEDAILCEIEATGKIIDEENKCVTDKIKIIREISKDEMSKLTNQGINNNGFRNTGDSNTGDCNTGDCNIGNSNSGYCNIGNHNTGNHNRGYCNKGYCNSGINNTGDWNIGNNSIGCFCTKKEKIKMFDKESNLTIYDWRKSDACYLLSSINKTKWIYYEDMTEEEKEKYPNAKTCNGYLKELNLKEEATKWWNNLTEEEKEIIRNIPNYNRAKFRNIMGGAKIG